jgi:hypothetical protein
VQRLKKQSTTLIIGLVGVALTAALVIAFNASSNSKIPTAQAQATVFGKLSAIATAAGTQNGSSASNISQPTQQASQVTSQNPVSQQPIVAPSPPEQKGTLKIHVTYSTSGNACGIGPTGYCGFSFPGRTIEIRTTPSGKHNPGTLLQSGISDASGYVSFSLPPGEYAIDPGPGDTIHPDASFQNVIIKSGSETFTVVDYWPIATTNGPLTPVEEL